MKLTFPPHHKIVRWYQFPSPFHYITVQGIMLLMTPEKVSKRIGWKSQFLYCQIRRSNITRQYTNIFAGSCNMYLHLLFRVFCKRQTMDWALQSYQHTLFSYTSASRYRLPQPHLPATHWQLIQHHMTFQ